MKIVHLIFSLNLGGAETMLIDILNLQVQDNQVAVFVVNEHYDPYLISKIDPRVKIKLFHRKRGSRNLFDIYCLHKELYRFRPEIIHCHDSNLIKMLLFSFGAKTVLTVHDVGLPLVGVLKYDHVIAISSAVKRDLDQRNVNKKTLIYNGIHFSNISKKIYLRDISGEKQFCIVQVSRLDYTKKGQDVLLYAIKILKEQAIRNIHVDFIGDGDSLNFLENLATELGVKDNVSFLGLKDRKYVYDHLSNYDLLIQPSIYEGFGLTVAEAMAAKVPVLVSENDGPIEIIQYGEYGYFFKNKDAVECALRIKDIISNYDIAIGKAERACNYCLEHFDIRGMVNNYLALYKSLL